MSPVRREWLVHGCMRLSDFDKQDRVSLKMRELISEEMYQGVEFGVRQWPRMQFRNTLWWYERSVEIPSMAASYFISLDNEKGPNLYAGVAVERAFEDENKAREYSSRNNQPYEWWILDKRWDWNKFLSSLPHLESLIFQAAKTLDSELYLWLECGENRNDKQYYVFSQKELYWRGGFKPIAWDEIERFVTKPRPKEWSSVSLVKCFSIEECTSGLDEMELLKVFKAMRQIRDLWRGILSLSG